MLELAQQVKLITNREEFVSFVKDLAKYLETHQPNQSTLDVISYMQSIAAWTSDMDGYYKNHGEKPPKEPSWRTVGEILIAALSYE